MRQQRGVAAQKESRVVGNRVAAFFGMVHIVHAQANDLAGVGHARRQGDGAQRGGFGGSRALSHTGLQARLVGALCNELSQRVRQSSIYLAAVHDTVAI